MQRNVFCLIRVKERDDNDVRTFNYIVVLVLFFAVEEEESKAVM